MWNGIRASEIRKITDKIRGFKILMPLKGFNTERDTDWRCPRCHSWHRRVSLQCPNCGHIPGMRPTRRRLRGIAARRTVERILRYYGV